MSSNTLSYRLAVKVCPEIAAVTKDVELKASWILDAILMVPFLGAGICWFLISLYPFDWITHWRLLILEFGLLLLFQHFRFFVFIEPQPRRHTYWSMFIWSVIVFSLMLNIGPIAILPLLAPQFFSFYSSFKKAPNQIVKWMHFRNFAQLTTDAMLGGAAAFYAYKAFGGTVPITKLTWIEIRPAVLALSVWWSISFGFWLLFFMFIFKPWSDRDFRIAQIKFWAFAMGWRLLVDPLAILAAGLYTQNGLFAYLFLMTGVFLISLLVRYLCIAIERSQRHARELSHLEQLGRLLMHAPADDIHLSESLKECVYNMFPMAHIEIRLFVEETLVHIPQEYPSFPDEIWRWMKTTAHPYVLEPGELGPWSSKPVEEATVVAPILSVETHSPIGAICLAQRFLFNPIKELLPALQSLAAQIAITLHTIDIYREQIAQKKLAQELELAWEIQTSFLPDDVAQIPDWELVVTLEPARQTTGDFYDFIQLENGWWGILIADVCGKGMGAALFMALCRTLIRTYAVADDPLPEKVFERVNDRLHADSQANLLITAFYGILDPKSGTLVYSNAGHNPPFIINDSRSLELPATGVPLGAFEDMKWERNILQLDPGDVWVLYTDGITEAMNPQGEFFGAERLLSVVQNEKKAPASRIHDKILNEIQSFACNQPQYDDATLMVLRRNCKESMS